MHYSENNIVLNVNCLTDRCLPSAGLLDALLAHQSPAFLAAAFDMPVHLLRKQLTGYVRDLALQARVVHYVQGDTEASFYAIRRCIDAIEAAIEGTWQVLLYPHEHIEIAEVRTYLGTFRRRPVAKPVKEI